MRSTIRSSFSPTEGEVPGDDFSGMEEDIDIVDSGSIPDRNECAAYISDLAGALSGLARRAGLRKVALFLQAAESEALMVQSVIASGHFDPADQAGIDAT